MSRHFNCSVTPHGQLVGGKIAGLDPITEIFPRHFKQTSVEPAVAEREVGVGVEMDTSTNTDTGTDVYVICGSCNAQYPVATAPNRCACTDDLTAATKSLRGVLGQKRKH